jgi:hypothetical protein
MRSWINAGSNSANTPIVPDIWDGATAKQIAACAGTRGP